MNRSRQFLVSVIPPVCVILLGGCPQGPSPGTDTTPPEFVQVVARLEARNPPNLRGEFDITSQDVSKTRLASDLVIRVNAVAGDKESAIKDIVTVSELSWQCSGGHNKPLIGTTQTIQLPFSAHVTPATPVTPFSINVIANPIAATGCSTATPGAGPINIRGFVRVTATNGANPPKTTTSKTFVFDYADVGVP